MTIRTDFPQEIPLHVDIWIEKAKIRGYLDGKRQISNREKRNQVTVWIKQATS